MKNQDDFDYDTFKFKFTFFSVAAIATIGIIYVMFYTEFYLWLAVCIIFILKIFETHVSTYDDSDIESYIDQLKIHNKQNPKRLLKR